MLDLMGLKTKVKTRERTDRSRYATLIKTLATKGKLKPADAATLEDVMRSLGKSVEQVEADVLLVQRVNGLAEAIKEVEADRSKIDEEIKVDGEYMRADSRIKRREEQNAKDAKVGGRLNRNQQRLSTANSATNEIERIKQEHAELFGA